MPGETQPDGGLGAQEGGERQVTRVLVCRSDEPGVSGDVVGRESERVEVGPLRRDRLGKPGEHARHALDPRGAEGAVAVEDEQ